MKIVVLGGGVIGVSTAYYLAKAGCDVTVIERQPDVALETSFANAGQVSPGYSAPWAGPGVPRKAVGWLLERDGPLVVRPGLNPRMYIWLLQLLRNCTASRYAVNKARMVRLAEYSRDCLDELRRDTGIAYDNLSRGTLQLFRKQSQLDHVGDDIEVLKQYAVPYEVLDRAGCIQAEPALANATAPIVGGLRLPGDETGDCQIFTHKLAAMARELGVTFMLDTTVENIAHAGGRIASVITSKGAITADVYVAACGSFTPALVRGLGLSVPVYPVKGYSLTIPIEDAASAPVSTVMDETFKVAITRLGDRVRVGGTAEVGDYTPRLLPSRRRPLDRSFSDLFGRAGNLEKASFWSGLRPMTPDGTPVIGATSYPNLYLNTGHGTLGWTMACGSARVVSDLIMKRKPDILTDDLALTRYR